MSATRTPLIGAGIERVDGLDKVTGEAQYAYERRIPDAAYVVPVLSTIARGTITAIDPAAALAEPGVLAVLHHGNAPELQRFDGVNPELLILQSPEVRYRGQMVAGVVATSLESAREAARLVQVSYDEEPHHVVMSLDDPELAVPEMANAGVPGLDEAGDVDAALASAAVVVQQTYETATNHHHPMEPHATLAVWEHDGLTLYDADQGPFSVATALSGLFGLELDQVRVIAEYVGGGFGSKALARPPAVLAAMAAKAVDRPVKVALLRPDMFSLVSHRPPSIQRVKLAADADGRLTGIEHDITVHTSRLQDYTDQVGASTRVVYQSPNRRVVHRLARLDIPTPGFMRGPGHASGMFALESAMDELAERLAIDPIELRIRNDTDIEPHSGKEFSSRDLVGALREGAERFGWADRDPTPGVRRDGRWLLGTGVAAAHHPDYTAPTVATARATDDGRFAVLVGASDIGTGARTAMLQIAAEALETELSNIDLTIGQSASGRAALAGGSMGTASWGWAVTKAGQALRAAIDEAGGVIGPDGIEVVADTTDDVPERAAMARHTFGAQFAAVRVDVDTGQVKVDRMLGVFAAGRIINRRTALSQFYGGMIMGLGQALLERSEIDPRFGDFANHDLASYHFASHADVPQLEVVMLEEEDRSPNPTRAKGIGELSQIGAAAAIGNALYHATGVRFRSIPIRIEDVRAGIAARR